MHDPALGKTKVQPLALWRYQVCHVERTRRARLPPTPHTSSPAARVPQLQRAYLRSLETKDQSPAEWVVASGSTLWPYLVGPEMDT